MVGEEEVIFEEFNLLCVFWVVVRRRMWGCVMCDGDGDGGGGGCVWSPWNSW